MAEYTEPAAERWVEHTIAPAEDGRMVRELLIRPLGLSNAMIRRLVQTEGVRLDGAHPFLSTRVAAGQRLAVRLSSPETGMLRPIPLELDVVYEDADVLVVNKPPGLLVHPTRLSHVHTLAHGITYRFRQQAVQARVHPVHRLDRNTSGLVLIAKHSPAHRQLARQLISRELERTYVALVHGTVADLAGTVDAPIGRHAEDAHLRTVRGDGAVARTHFRVVERYATATRVELELETGRTHQIRVHMAHLGHPLLGDAPYGGEATPLLQRQALHAHRLRFTHPLTRQPIVCEAPIPADLERLIQTLRRQSRG